MSCRKKSIVRRPIAQQVVSTSAWLEREPNRITKHAAELDKGQTALLQQKGHFKKNSGWRHSRHSWRQSRQYVEYVQRPTTRTRIEKELVLGRTAAARVDDEDTSLSAKRVKRNLEASGRDHSSAEETEVQI